MEESKKKSRNFLDRDRRLIIDWYEQNEQILTPKLGCKVTAAEKNQAWEQLTASINAENPSTRRTVPQMKKKWSNMKGDVTTALSKERQHVEKTGGGGPHPGLDEIDTRVLTIIGEDSPTIIGIDGGANSLINSSSHPASTATVPLAQAPLFSAASSTARLSTATPPRGHLATSSSVPCSPLPHSSRILYCGDTLSARKRKGDSYDEYLQAETKKAHAEADKLLAERQMLVEKATLINLQKEYVHLQILKLRAEMDSEDRKFTSRSELIDLSTCSFDS